MQVIPGNTSMTNGVHVLETPDHIIINSQLYDKATMEPKPYCFWNINTTGYSNHLQNACNILEPNVPHVTKGGAYQRWVQDNKDPDIFYFINQSASSVVQYFVVVRKTETGYEIVHQSAPWSGTTHFTYNYDHHNYKILGQTDNFIVLWRQGFGDNGSGNGDSGWYGGWRRKQGELVRISKSNFAFAYSTNHHMVETYWQVLETDANRDIMWLLCRSDGHIYIGPYNVATNTLRWVWSDTTGTYATSLCPGLSDAIQFQGKHVIFTNTSTHTGYQFQMFQINKDTEEVTRTMVPCESHVRFPFHQWGKGRWSCGWMVFTLKNIDDKYIAVTAHNDENSIISFNNYGNDYAATLFSGQGWHRHIVYRHNKDGNTFTPTDVIDMGNNTIHLYGVLYYDQYTCVFFSNVSFQFWRFNPATERYEKGYEKSGTFYTLGFDELKRFYAIDHTNVCRIYTNITACVLDAQFELQSYYYQNHDIYTYVMVSAQNFDLDYIETQVELILSGPCQFEDGTRRQVLTTLSHPMGIPVIVTGGGSVHCHIKQVEVAHE